MAETPASGVEVVRHGATAVLTLNRPAQRNAMSSELVEALIADIARLEADLDVRVLVLTGAGRGFCAGSDLAQLAGMSAEGRLHFEAASGRLARMFAQLSKPVLAAVHGFAIGGGLTLAAACDVVVADAASKWSLPEAPIGLFPAWGLGVVVERIGRPAARRLSWGVDTLSGEAAYRIGLVDQLADEPLAEALALAERLAALPASQAASVKEYFAVEATGEVGDALANRLFARAALSDEAVASFAKFAAKG